LTVAGGVSTAGSEPAHETVEPTIKPSAANRQNGNRREIWRRRRVCEQCCAGLPVCRIPVPYPVLTAGYDRRSIFSGVVTNFRLERVRPGSDWQILAADLRIGDMSAGKGTRID
jgi:hypothetical protein